MTCPYLEYRTSADGTSFDHDRAFCAAAGRFVEPMRADVCNDRYDLQHETDCEIYRDAEGLPQVPGVGADPPAEDPTDGPGAE